MSPRSPERAPTAPQAAPSDVPPLSAAQQKWEVSCKASSIKVNWEKLNIPSPDTQDCVNTELLALVQTGLQQRAEAESRRAAYESNTFDIARTAGWVYKDDFGVTQIQNPLNIKPVAPALISTYAAKAGLPTETYAQSLQTVWNDLHGGTVRTPADFEASVMQSSKLILAKDIGFAGSGMNLVISEGGIALTKKVAGGVLHLDMQLSTGTLATGRIEYRTKDAHYFAQLSTDSAALGVRLPAGIGSTAIGAHHDNKTGTTTIGANYQARF